MNLKTFLFIILILTPSLLFSQSNFNIEYDHSSFCLDEKSGYIEIYYSIQPQRMQIAVSNNDTTVEGNLSINIFEGKKRKPVVDRTWQFSRKISNRVGDENNNMLVGLFRFELPKGSYSCDIMGHDENDSLKQFIKTFDFDIKVLNDDRFTLSDLQLASSIVKSTEASDSPFYKNQYEVVPNPGLIFGSQLPVAYIYCELYGLNLDAESKMLQIDYSLVDGNNQQLISKTKFVPSSIPSMVFVKPINVRNYPGGRHRMTLSVSDTIRNIAEQVTKNFYIYNSHIVDSSDVGMNAIVVASEYFSMSEKEIEDLFALSRYIASDVEVREWNRLTNYHDKQVFLYHFWRARDMTPENLINEFKEEYLGRAAIADERYYTLNKKGWATDRGRVYVLYGEPSDIERHPSDIEARPYEIWHYDHIEGRVIFVFADLYGYSDLYLIHSTKQGELSDPNWRRKVDTF
jgi:GWxTD domain-containing protein